ncbi:cytochrome c oxidase subunit 3 [bacterium SCSIO 12643]|nr:cytochrome c oxidase subunit 3 [bacterium SCSIO 12643]
MASGISIQEQGIIRSKTAKPLLWVAMAGMSMIFASLTSAYVVRQADSDWLSIELPMQFYYSTAIIVLSSITLVFADVSAKKNNQTGIKIGLISTFVLSLAFVYSQFDAYNILMDQGFYFSGSGISSSFLYVLTIVHLAHVFGGNISLLITSIKGLKGKYSAEDKLGIELASWYWHYLTGVWMFLLMFLLYIK